MLVIGRRASEPIVMARDVEIEVLESSPTRACWASARPKQVLVVRKELGITADENRAASHKRAPPAGAAGDSAACPAGARPDSSAPLGYGVFTGTRTTLLTNMSCAMVSCVSLFVVSPESSCNCTSHTPTLPGSGVASRTFAVLPPANEETKLTGCATGPSYRRPVS
jgi:sRNA-binding carbon storage regulator CsrA